MLRRLTKEGKAVLGVLFLCLLLSLVVILPKRLNDESIENTSIQTTTQETTQETANETTIATTTVPTEITTIETVAPVAISATTTATTATTTTTTITVQPTETEPPVLEVPRFYLTEEERRIVECVVMGEAGAESYEGQVLVAQCILNACLLEGWQPSQVRVNYRYAGWHDEPSQSVKDAVGAVFDHGFEIVSEPIVYFYAPKLCQSQWHESQTWVITEGGHKFFMNNQ